MVLAFVLPQVVKGCLSWNRSIRNSLDHKLKFRVLGNEWAFFSRQSGESPTAAHSLSDPEFYNLSSSTTASSFAPASAKCSEEF